MSIIGQWVNTTCPTKHWHITRPRYCCIINNVHPNAIQGEEPDAEGHTACDPT